MDRKNSTRVKECKEMEGIRFVVTNMRTCDSRDATKRDGIRLITRLRKNKQTNKLGSGALCVCHHRRTGWKAERWATVRSSVIRSPKQCHSHP